MNAKQFFTFILLLSSLSCFSQGNGWITNKTTGCKYFTDTNSSIRTVKWNGACLNKFVNGKGTLQVYEKTKLIFTYTGNCLNGHISGNGKITYVDGTIYNGEWKNDKYEGKGQLYLPDGSKYDCTWEKGYKIGRGCYFDKAGNMIVKTFSNNGTVEVNTGSLVNTKTNSNSISKTSSSTKSIPSSTSSSSSKPKNASFYAKAFNDPFKGFYTNIPIEISLKLKLNNDFSIKGTIEVTQIAEKKSYDTKSSISGKYNKENNEIRFDDFPALYYNEEYEEYNWKFISATATIYRDADKEGCFAIKGKDIEGGEFLISSCY